MTWKKVDMEADPRSGQFAYFRAMVNPWAGVTVPVEITAFHKALNGRPFFLSFLYAAVRAANDVPELRRRLRDGEVIEYDRCQPSYTAMRPNGVYVYCLVDSGTLPYEAFIREGKRKQQEALERKELKETGDSLNHFFVSSLPWLSYTQIQHPCVSADDSNPRLSWGKFTEENGKVMLPVSLAGGRLARDPILSESGAGAGRADRPFSVRKSVSLHKKWRKSSCLNPSTTVSMSCGRCSCTSLRRKDICACPAFP